MLFNRGRRTFLLIRQSLLMVMLLLLFTNARAQTLGFRSVFGSNMVLPHGKSVVRDTSATVEGALAKACPGDTVELFGFSGTASVRWQDRAARRGVTLTVKGN